MYKINIKWCILNQISIWVSIIWAADTVMCYGHLEDRVWAGLALRHWGSERHRPHALLSHVRRCWSISFPKWVSIYWKFHFLLLQHFICFISSCSYLEEIIQILCSISIFNKLNKTWPPEKNQTLDCKINKFFSPIPPRGPTINPWKTN